MNEHAINGLEELTVKRIDYILCTDQFKPTTAEIIRGQYDGLWPSDHYPVLCTLVIPEPSTATMLLMLVGFGLFGIRRKKEQIRC